MIGNTVLRFVRWIWRGLVRRAGLYGLFTFAVLFMTYRFALEGLAGVIDGLVPVYGRISWLIFFCLLVGFWVANKRYWLASLLFVFAVSAPIIFVLMGNLVDELWLVLRAFSRVGEHFIGHLINRLPLADFVLSDDLELARLNFMVEAWTYADEVRIWFAGLRTGEPTLRTGAVEFVWGLMISWFAVWSGAVLRGSKQVLLAMLPLGAVFLMTLAYARVQSLGMLVLFLSGVLVLHAAGIQHGNEVRWEKSALDYPADMRVDFSVSSSVLIGGIVIAAYFIPQVNFRTFLRGVMGLDRPAIIGPAGGDGEIGEAFGLSLPTQPPPFFDDYVSGGLPRNHLLDLSPEERFAVVLEIQVTAPQEFNEQRYYWRSLTYDEYTGRGWAAGETKTVRYNRGVEIPVNEQPFAPTIRQQVEWVNSSGPLIYAAGDMISINQPYEVAWYTPVADVFNAFGVRIQNQVSAYTIDTRYPILHVPTLRRAGTDYPAWVAERYLALPENIPQRVHDLAMEITAGYENPYDEALALEMFLRQYEYTLAVPAVPDGVDVVEYFLFDLQRGYCDYYSTAMVVMARSVGLPARLAIGYAEGRYDQAEETYFIIGNDAHSWPEIYFPGFGWVPFEPTAGLELSEPVSQELPPGFEPVTLPPLIAPDPGLLDQVYRLAAVMAGILGVGLVIWVGVDWVRYMRQTPEGFMREIMQKTYAYSRVLAVQMPDRATPNELSAAFLDFLLPWVEKSAVLRRYPDTDRELAVLRDTYNRLVYSTTEITKDDKTRALKAWRKLRLKFFWISVQKRIQKPSSKAS